MLPQLVLYLATVCGAAALYLLMPKPGRDLRVFGGLLGAAALGGLWLVLLPLFLVEGGPMPGSGGGPMSFDTGFDGAQLPFYYAFSAVGIVAAVRVITHTRPVYAALWFVMVVIASAGLMLTLAAEFMALAMVIIYGGAILVTYMFVIMLATPPQAEDESALTEAYDRFAAEPLWAVVAGFLLLAVILSVAFMPMAPNQAARLADDAVLQASTFTGRATVDELKYGTPTGFRPVDPADPNATMSIRNVEHVGLDLFRSHPLAIELAGIILLLALIGAVAIARTQVDDLEPDGDPERVDVGPVAPVIRDA